MASDFLILKFTCPSLFIYDTGSLVCRKYISNYIEFVEIPNGYYVFLDTTHDILWVSTHYKSGKVVLQFLGHLFYYVRMFISYNLCVSLHSVFFYFYAKRSTPSLMRIDRTPLHLQILSLVSGKGLPLL